MKKRNHIFPNLIKVNINKVKNNFFVPKMNNSPRYYTNNQKYFSIHDSSIKSPKVNTPYNNYSKNMTIDTIEKNRMKHYQSRDNLSDQLNLIRFKMSCDLIGQKMNQLQSFVDGMKINKQNKMV